VRRNEEKNMKIKVVAMLCLVIFLLSCATVRLVGEREQKMFVLDLTEYSEKDFLFTTESYSGKYMTMGFINYSEKADYESLREWADNEFYTDYRVGEIDIDAAIGKVYEEAIKLNGDGVMNFDISYSDTTIFITELKYFKVPGCKISGIVIKRLD